MAEMVRAQAQRARATRERKPVESAAHAHLSGNQGGDDALPEVACAEAVERSAAAVATLGRRRRWGKGRTQTGWGVGPASHPQEEGQTGRRPPPVPARGGQDGRGSSEVRKGEGVEVTRGEDEPEEPRGVQGMIQM